MYIRRWRKLSAGWWKGPRGLRFVLTGSGIVDRDDGTIHLSLQLFGWVYFLELDTIRVLA